MVEVIKWKTMGGSAHSCIKNLHKPFLAAFVAFALLYITIFFPHTALAAIAPSAGVALPLAVSVPIADAHLSYGDIVSYEKELAVYALSRKANDPNLFGVVAKRPPLVFFLDDTTVPVVRSGRTLVNVTLENGPIRAGDFITSSSILGKGQRAAAGDSYVVGVAVGEFVETGDAEAVLPNGKKVGSGTIVVDVNVIGLFAAAATTDAGLSDDRAKTVFGLDTETAFTIMQYVLAAAITLGSLYLAFRSFMSDANYGVISVGRNPRARSSIQAMVVFNAILAILVAGAGIFVAMFVLFVEL